MYTSKLAVVNACLATLGEAPLNTLTEQHTYKDAALNYLESSNRVIQARSLWFNTEDLRLQPDASTKFIYVPQNLIKMQRHEGAPPFSERGRRLYDPLLNRYEWDTDIYVRATTLLEFEDCPFVAKDAISLTAIMLFQQEYDGDSTRYQQIDRNRQRAEMELNAQHIREAQINLLDPVRESMVLNGIYRTNRTRGAIPVNYVIRR